MVHKVRARLITLVVLNLVTPHGQIYLGSRTRSTRGGLLSRKRACRHPNFATLIKKTRKEAPNPGRRGTRPAVILRGPQPCRPAEREEISFTFTIWFRGSIL